MSERLIKYENHTPLFFKNTYCATEILIKEENYFSFNCHLNRGFLVYMFSLRFSGSKVLINLRRQFRVRKIFRTQVFAGFAVFSFCISFVRNLCSNVAPSLKIAH